MIIRDDLSNDELFIIVNCNLAFNISQTLCKYFIFMMNVSFCFMFYRKNVILNNREASVNNIIYYCSCCMLESMWHGMAIYYI